MITIFITKGTVVGCYNDDGKTWKPINLKADCIIDNVSLTDDGCYEYSIGKTKYFISKSLACSY